MFNPFYRIMVTRRETLFSVIVALSVALCHGQLLKGLKATKIGSVLTHVQEIAEYTLEEIQSFDLFKSRFNKTYSSVLEEQTALLNFLINQKEIQVHNLKVITGLTSFARGLWEFSDMSTDEINLKVNGFSQPVEAKAMKNNEDDYDEQDESLPESINWVDEGYVTAVENQKLCGSCWSFSAIGAVEGQMFKETGKLRKFSQQNLIDCNRDDEVGNFGCSGGSMIAAFDYLISQEGVALASKYPYQALDTLECEYRKSQSGGKVLSYKTLEPGDESLLQEMVAKHGPVSIAVDASLSSFHSYKSGVYYDSKCSKNPNHAVLLVGYGRDEDSEKDYWLVKNSYGEEWGEDGYIRIARNEDNHCGITEFAVVPNCE